jgi:diguanylate cyclase (GGDEF)-like protein
VAPLSAFEHGMDLTGTPHPHSQHGLLFLENQPLSRTWAIVAVVAAFSVIFVLDLMTGSAPVQHLYYLPIIFTAARFGGRSGFWAALLAIVLYHLTNPRALTFHYGETDLLQIAMFIAVGMIADNRTNHARRLHQLAMTDDLTRLHNLRSFEPRLRNMVRVARESKTPLSVLVLDLDRLKSLNDVYGHLAGAEAVQMVGHILATRLPAESAACRYGGDEFVIALPRCGQVEATDVAEDLRRAVSAVAPVLAGVSFPAETLSISVGVASCAFEPNAGLDRSFESDADGNTLFRAADVALYAAKNGGRNRVAYSPALRAEAAEASRK